MAVKGQTRKGWITMDELGWPAFVKGAGAGTADVVEIG